MRIDLLVALVLLLLVNLIAFLAQGLDKLQAKRSATRVSESALLALGVPLAAPGMWLGMRLFHHKTRKLSFLAGAWIVTALNLLLVWLLIEASRRGWFELGSIRRGP